MRTVLATLMLFAACGNQDTITTVPEPGPDGPPPSPDMGVDLDVSCIIPKTCVAEADCDDCNPCTVDTCGPDGCETAPIFPCCGDDFCSDPETCDTCSADCGACGCCMVQSTAGCANATAETCVCTNPAPDADKCCTELWDLTCVMDVTTLGCGTCDCCMEHPGIGGCLDQVVAACVCNLFDPTCCSESWDAQCVSAVEGSGCGDCP